MTYVLLIVLRILLAIGAAAGLGMCFWSSVHGDWPIALVSFGVYSFSLVMLS